MKIIGVIIGTEDEPVSKEYYKRSCNVSLAVNHSKLK